MAGIGTRWMGWAVAGVLACGGAALPSPAPAQPGAGQAMRETAYTGAWSARLPAASAPAREVTLELRADHAATLTSNARNGRASVRSEGRWSTASGRRVRVDLRRAGTTTGVAERIVFHREGNTLRAVEYDRRQWGRLGLTLRRARATVPGPPLDATRWEAQWVSGVPAAQLAQRRPTLEFLAGEWRAAGNAACNRFSGSYTQSAGRLSFGALASTRMACTEPALNATETAYLRALEQTATYEISRGILVLRASGGREVARLRMALVR
jgi:heat shock protein HslJ